MEDAPLGGVELRRAGTLAGTTKFSRDPERPRRYDHELRL
jgi:hypothetical protein